jgi:site-specific recombinase XerD/transcriptional regulator with XRE-family HTH domain
MTMNDESCQQVAAVRAEAHGVLPEDSIPAALSRGCPMMGPEDSRGAMMRDQLFPSPATNPYPVCDDHPIEIDQVSGLECRHEPADQSHAPGDQPIMPTSQPTREPCRAGRLMAEWCAANAVSQTELSKRLGFSPSWVNHVVKGYTQTPDFKLLRRVAEVTSIPFSDLTADRPIILAEQLRAGMRMDAVLRAVEAGQPKPDGTPLGDARRTEIIQHLKRLPRLVEMPLDRIPADPRALRDKMKGWNAAAFRKLDPGITDRAIEKIKSSISVALQIAGARISRQKGIKMLGAEWRALYDAAAAFEKERGIRVSFQLQGIAPFMRWCNAHSITPEEVCEDAFARYVAEREANDLDERPRAQRLAQLRLAWNHFARQAPGWPARIFEVPQPDRLRLPEKVFPQTFRDDLDAYVRALGVRNAHQYDPKVAGYLEAARARAKMRAEWRSVVGKNPNSGRAPMTYDPAMPLRLVSAEGHRDTLRFAASVLVRHRIRTPDEITCIQDVATLEVAAAVLRDYDERHGHDHVASTRRTLVTVLMSIAARWRTDFEDEERQAFQALKTMVTTPKREMTQEERDVVSVFLTSSDEMARLISLPLWIHQEAAAVWKTGAKFSERQALDLEAACKIVILSSLPVRLSTLAATALANIKWPHPAAPGTIYWPVKHTKTEKPLMAVLAPWKMQIIMDHVAHGRSALGATDETWLFPGRRLGYEHEHRSEQRVAENLRDLIERRIGIRIHTHLWRKLMAGLLFDATKDERVVRYLLSHSPNSKSTDVYVDQMRSRWASGKLEEITEALIGNREALTGKRRRS